MSETSFGVCVSSADRAAEIVGRLVGKRVPFAFEVPASGSYQVTVSGEHASALMDAVDASDPSRCAQCGERWTLGSLNSHRECPDCARNRAMREE